MVYSWGRGYSYSQLVQSPNILGQEQLGNRWGASPPDVIRKVELCVCLEANNGIVGAGLF
jgi:hypothetical protein